MGAISASGFDAWEVLGPVTIGEMNGLRGFDFKADHLGPGSSGGVVIDINGLVVGILEGKDDAGGVLAISVGPLMR